MTPYIKSKEYLVYAGDSMTILQEFPSDSIDCCVTSPPYYNLRDYGAKGQLGKDQTIEEYIENMVCIFREVRRLLHDDGTLWLNLGDSYGKKKQLLGIPWRVALALQQDGWILRMDIIWEKPNAKPESAKDRCTRSHEYIFHLTKSENYYYDVDSIREPHDSAYSRDAIEKAGGLRKTIRPKGDNFNKENRHVNGIKTPSTRAERAALLNPLGRNKRSVWCVKSMPYKGAHSAVFPPELIVPCVMASSRVGAIVLDPFGGSGTTAGVANALGRRAILCELNKKTIKQMPTRIAQVKATLEEK